jgi:DNA-binding response OmpR family regulator
MITRAMLAEDEEVAREILSFYLETIFDEVVVVKDGQEGLETYKKHLQQNIPFDLIITDIKMPRLDGLKMLEFIHNLNPKQKFIIVSAYKDEENLLKSIELQVLGYFVKPLNVDNVMHMLKKAKEEVLQDRKEEMTKIQINSIFAYDKKEKLLYENNTLVKLSAKESTLLEILIQNQGKIISQEALKIAIWEDEQKSDSTFRALMKRLKDKIKTGDFILSRKSQGYIIE